LTIDVATVKFDEDRNVDGATKITFLTMMARGGLKGKKPIRCSTCLELGHKKRSSKCSRYFETAILKPTRSMDDDAEVTKAVKRIRRSIDKQPEILKEEIFGEEKMLPLHWVALRKYPLQVVQLIYEKYPEAIERTSLGCSPLVCALSNKKKTSGKM
jgi:hypothetical protein